MNNATFNILHIAPHLGGGIGRALSGLFEYEKGNSSRFLHSLVMLEEPKNKQFFDICKNYVSGIKIACSLNDISEEFYRADVVVLHWWHHPLNAHLLANFPDISTRLIIWSHVNGCTYPVLPFELVSKVHGFFITSKYTLDNPHWSIEEKQLASEKIRLVYGLGKFSKMPPKVYTSTEKFIIGYIGTLNFSKLNPDFVDYCRTVVDLIPSAYFVLVGDIDGREIIMRHAENYGIAERFEFTGYTTDVNSQLERFDVFGYPLNPLHFGTTENVILEAMNAGLPVVALNQNCEKYLIKHNETGYLADNQEHYALLIKYLYDHPGEIKRIANNAKTNLQMQFSMKNNISSMHQGLLDVLQLGKRKLDFRSVIGEKPYEWFLKFLGKERIYFENCINDYPSAEVELYNNCPDILKGESKSSVMHFLEYFNDDKVLQKWNSILNSNKL